MATLLELGPFGQMVSVHTYNLKTLGFTTPDDAAQDRAVASLIDAANKLVSDFPYLAGQVVNSGATSTSSGTFSVVAYPPHEGPEKFIHVKDCKELLKPYKEILEAKAPLSMLDGRIVSPAYGFPYMYPSAEAMPVVIVQVNLLKGGIFLTTAFQHDVTDANADSRMIEYFARRCAGGELLPEELELGNGSREKFFPQATNTEELDPMECFRLPGTLPHSPPWPPQYGNAPWYCFRMDAAKIAALKDIGKSPEANEPKNDAYSAPFFSTDDIMSALIWKHMIRSRSLTGDDITPGLVRAVNGRPHFDPPVPAKYIGHAVTCAWTRVPMTDLSTLPLRSLAFALRKSLLEYASPARMRSLVHLLRTTEDQTSISYGAAMNMETDVMLTSHVGHGVYNVDFGEKSGLGRPDVVRRPNLPDGRGLVYMLPKGRDGSIDIVASLLPEDLKTLREGEGSEEWNKYWEYIG